jgi:glycosyltransferase involved in cell wall biosynthesis
MSGNFGYEPNAAGARWFLKHVWPRLRVLHPELRWRLLGRGSHALAGRWGIDAKERFDDAIEELARSRVAVVPLHSGSGTRLKILEAWAAGVPVVSTTLGVEGLQAADGANACIADSPDLFAARVSGLLTNPAQADALSRSARLTFEIEYTWETAWRQLREAGI